jgi:CheY-like chemotaxis protein
MPKLLLADDSVTIQRVIELTFSGEDVSVVTVGDGEEAIARIPTERPDIVLADIGMPKRSGYDVAAFVKSHPELAHIPVLLLAGAFEPVDQARAEQVQCDGVLVKPFEPQQVIARVRELIEGAKGSPMRATAGVPRPIERLSPPPREQAAATRDAGRGGASPPTSADAAVTAAGGGRPPDIEARVIETRPIVEMPESSGTAPGGDSLDDYFDRLDAAFASLGNGPGAAGAAAPPSPVLDELASHVDVPTIDDLLGAVPLHAVPGDLSSAARIAAPPVEPPDSASTLAASPRPAARPEVEAARSPEALPQPQDTQNASTRNVIADVFSALLAAEQGEAGAPLRLPSMPSQPIVTDALVDEVTRRVLERLAPAAARDVVAAIVSEIAERLVREEIARIRNA